MSNCTPATAKRIQYIEYDGDIYDVASTDPYPPRMSSILGDIAKITEDDLNIVKG
jgi:hypothetical protein